MEAKEQEAFGPVVLRASNKTSRLLTRRTLAGVADALTCPCLRGLQSLWRIPVTGGVPATVVGAGDDAITPAIAREGDQLAFVVSHMNANIWRAAGPATKFGPPAKFITSTRQEYDVSFSPSAEGA